MVCPLLVTGAGGDDGTIFVTSDIAWRELSTAANCSAVVPGTLVLCTAICITGAGTVPVLLDAGALNDVADAGNGVLPAVPAFANLFDTDAVWATVR